MSSPSQARALPLAAVGDDVPLTPQERAQARRDRERALRDPDRYGRAVHLACVQQRRRDRTPTMPTRRARPRTARRHAARRTGASSATSGSDPGGGDPDPPLDPAALAEAQRVLDGAARRLLAERSS